MLSLLIDRDYLGSHGLSASESDITEQGVQRITVQLLVTALLLLLISQGIPL